MFLLRDDRPLNDYVLQPSEVDAILDAPITDLLNLFSGDLEEMNLVGVQHAGSAEATDVTTTATVESFVPGTSYWVNLLVMCERFLRGERPLAI